MIKYSYALINGKPIHIDEVTEEIRKNSKFYCLDESCESREMAAHILGSRKRHFQHIHYTEHSNESYLHSTAKKVLKSSFEKAIRAKEPFILVHYVNKACIRLRKHTGLSCDFGITFEETDLIKYYDEIKEEKYSGSFRPDLELISSKGLDSIFFEIKVTHGITTKKLMSGHRIVEIVITNEGDIRNLERNRLSVRQSNVSLRNFEIREKQGDYCGHREHGCSTTFEFFILYKDGKFEFCDESLDYIATCQSGIYGDPFLYEIEPFKNSKTLGKASDFDKKLHLIEKMRAKNFLIKSCNLCKYSDLDSRNSQLMFCKFLKKNPDLEEAQFCDYFRISE